MYLLVTLIEQNFKQILRADLKLWERTIFRPKLAHGPFLLKDFFRKTINNACCNHSCLSICKKSESDVNLIMRYWRLKNTEIWEVENIFGHKLRTKFLPNMWFWQNVKGKTDERQPLLYRTFPNTAEGIISIYGQNE